MDEERGRTAGDAGAPRDLADLGDLDVTGYSVAGLVAASLLSHDLPGASADERDRAARYVDDSVAAMPDFTRFGVRVAGAAAYGALCVLSGGRFRTRPEARRARAAARLVAVPLPVLGEFGRLTRGLGLVSVHEQRQHAPVDVGVDAVQDPAP